MIIDLSQTIETGMQVYPGSTEVEICNCSNYDTDDWHIDLLKVATHAGTHIDAPFHHFEHGKKINEFPLEKFVGIGAVLDLTGKESLAEISQKELQPYEELLDEIDIVIVKTGWEKFYGSKEYENHPYLSEEAARYLVDRKISIAGVDTFSFDSTALNTEHVHNVLLANEVLLVENLKNLDELQPMKKYFFSFMPLAIKETDGSPIRAICWNID